jgi:hypothetical protein
MNRECENSLTCPRRIGRDILAAAGLSDGLWAAEALVAAPGVTIYHVARWSEILGTNEQCIARGQSPEFSPFALCRTYAEALATCGQMCRKQEALRLLGGPVDDDSCRCEVCEGAAR